MATKIVLVHPPLDDPTIPYHACAYLKGHLVRSGFTDVVIRDINIEYVNHLFNSTTVAYAQGESRRRVQEFARMGALNYQQQENYYGLLNSRAIDPDDLASAIQRMRDLPSFLDFPSYVAALDLIKGYMTMIGGLSYPSDLNGFAPVTRGRFSLANLADLLNPSLAEQACWMFQAYFKGNLLRDPEFLAADIIGISIIYDHQLIHAFQLARMIKAQWPEKSIVLGGTAVSQLFKWLKNKALARQFFQLCDAIVLGEGESAICELADAGNGLRGKTFRNTLTYSSASDKLHIPEVQYENLVELGTPLYDYPWPLYLSPQHGINYSPTRGCYWNRCTFCDYGLNTDKPTSPWRERPIDSVIEDLRSVRRATPASYVYFAVDVMSPVYLDRLSDALVDADLGVSWSCELRLERSFSKSRVEKMKRAGCVCVSFGMESGNQRILDLIDKGTKVDAMRATMKEFSEAGVACQLMAFTGFPSETASERDATYKFIKDNEPYWSNGGVGTFMLTGTAIIAKTPAAFGIEILETQNADIMRSVAFRAGDGNSLERTLPEVSDASFGDSRGIFPNALDRPWAGGIDSLHSMIYYRYCGAGFFKRNPPSGSIEVAEIDDRILDEATIRLTGRLVRSAINLRTICNNKRQYLQYISECAAKPAEPTHAAFSEWARGIQPLTTAEPGEQGWLVKRVVSVPLSSVVFGLLTVASERAVPLGKLTQSLPPATIEQLRGAIKQLERHGLIALSIGGRTIRSPESAARLQGILNSTPGPTVRASEADRQQAALVSIEPVSSVGKGLP